MSIKKSCLLASVMAVAHFLVTADVVLAEGCATPPSCTELGYTQTSCASGQRAIKCPTDPSRMLCSGGSSSGSSGSSPSCSLGDIYFSDDTCSANMVSGKTAIGIVFDTSKKLVMSLNSETLYWGGVGDDVSGAPNYSSSSEALADMDGLANTTAAINCWSFTDEAYDFCYHQLLDVALKPWYLPALGEMASWVTNKTTLNTALAKTGSPDLGSDYYWSSSEMDENSAWALSLAYSSVSAKSRKKRDNSYPVRCVFKY